MTDSDGATLLGRRVRKRFTGYGRGALAWFEGSIVDVENSICIVQWDSDQSESRMKEGIVCVCHTPRDGCPCTQNSDAEKKTTTD